MFFYEKGILGIKQNQRFIPIQEIAQGMKTPFYLYDIEALRHWYQFFMESTNHQLQVFFAMKANFNKDILTAFKEEGSGVDVVSGGEARLAEKIGFKPKKIIFSGVGKTWIELEEAIKKDFFQINVESLEELKRIALICEKQKKTCKIGLRINPNIDFQAHPYIKTGLTGHKFGFEEEELPEILDFLRSKPLIHLQGLSMHLGSQIFDLEPLFKAIRHLKKLYEELQCNKYPLKVMDIGGGLAINYEQADLEEEKTCIKNFGQALQTLLKNFDGTIITEPGRFLVAPFGILCAKVEYVKKSPKKNFIILNSGMNHFLRPSLYNAKHRILPFYNFKGAKKDIYDVVGPICETGDTFAMDYPLPILKSEDWLAIADTGAYGFVMANAYNLQLPIKEISLFKGQKL